MTRKLLIVGAVAVVAAAAWATWFVLTHREPVYQGKSLSAWMDQWNNAPAGRPEIARLDQAARS